MEGLPVWVLAHDPVSPDRGVKARGAVGQARFGVRASLPIPDLESKVEENIYLENPK